MENKIKIFNDKGSLYYQYNPIIQYAIKPALRLADAHNHPIRGGIAAAVASGLAHYGVVELVVQGADIISGAQLVDPNTKLAITNMAWPIHAFIGCNMISNVLIGINKYYKQRKQNLVSSLS